MLLFHLQRELGDPITQASYSAFGIVLQPPKSFQLPAYAEAAAQAYVHSLSPSILIVTTFQEIVEFCNTLI
jgi:hypothetical protein